MKRVGEVRWSAVFLLLVGLIYPALANDDLPEDIALLEFLGTIAGLESMGIEIDALLDGDTESLLLDTASETEENQS